MPTLYIAGPMSDLPQFNFPAFYEAQKIIESQGHTAINPAELDPPEVQEAAWASVDGSMDTGRVGGHTWGELLARDVKAIADNSDGVVLLPGWQTSKGARLERMIAQLCGLPVYELVGHSLRPCSSVFHLVNQNV